MLRPSNACIRAVDIQCRQRADRVPWFRKVDGEAFEKLVLDLKKMSKLWMQRVWSLVGSCGRVMASMYLRLPRLFADAHSRTWLTRPSNSNINAKATVQLKHKYITGFKLP